MHFSVCPSLVVAVSFTGSESHSPSVLPAFLPFFFSPTEEIHEKELNVRTISESLIYSSHVKGSVLTSISFLQRILIIAFERTKVNLLELCVT